MCVSRHRDGLVRDSSETRRSLTRPDHGLLLSSGGGSLHDGKLLCSKIIKTTPILSKHLANLRQEAIAYDCDSNKIHLLWSFLCSTIIVMYYVNQS